MFNKIYYFNNHQGGNHSSSVGRARSLYYGNIDLSRWFESSWEQILIYVKLVFLRFSTDYIMQGNCSAKSIENCTDLLEIFWTVGTQNFKSWPRAVSEIWMDEARSLVLLEWKRTQYNLYCVIYYCYTFVRNNKHNWKCSTKYIILIIIREAITVAQSVELDPCIMATLTWVDGSNPAGSKF